MYLLNAFSLNMLGDIDLTRLTVRRISVDEARCLGVEAESAVGHPDTARLFTRTLGFDVPHRRATVQLQPGDVALVGQYVGPRLPAGSEVLPEGADLRWFEVRMEPKTA